MNTKDGLLFLACFAVLLILACSEESNMVNDMDPPECEEEFSFSSDIEEIINSTCAYSGCHVAGTGLPQLTTYDQVVTQIENGNFEDRVLVRQNMPPSNAIGPTELSESEILLIQCWIDQGYQE